MNYVIGHGPEGKNNQGKIATDNPFLALKEKLAGKLTDELRENDGISESIKSILGKMGIQKVPVLKNGITYVTVQVNGILTDLPIEDKISINDSVFVERTNRGNVIMRSWEIQNAMNLAKTIEKRQNLVSKAWEVTRGSGPQSNKILFNNLMRDSYTKSNQETFYNTIMEGEELIGKVTSKKVTVRKPGYTLVTIHFNDNCFGKILVDSEDMGYIGDKGKDLQYGVGDYCFVRVTSKGINHRAQRKEINLKFTHDDLVLMTKDGPATFQR